RVHALRRARTLADHSLRILKPLSAFRCLLSADVSSDSGWRIAVSDKGYLLKFGSPSASTSSGTAAGALPSCRNTIECCDGTSNFFPHVLHVTASSTRIM